MTFQKFKAHVNENRDSVLEWATAVSQVGGYCLFKIACNPEKEKRGRGRASGDTICATYWAVSALLLKAKHQNTQKKKSATVKTRGAQLFCHLKWGHCSRLNLCKSTCNKNKTVAFTIEEYLFINVFNYPH